MIDIEKLYLEGIKSDFIAVDTETTGLNWQIAELVGVGIGNLEWCYWVPGDMFKEYHYVFEDLFEKVPVVMHNAKYDLHILDKYMDNKVLENMTLHDTMIMSALLDENTSHTLQGLIQQRFGLFRDEKNVGKMNESELAEHCLKDVFDTAVLFKEFTPEITQNDLENAYLVERQMVKVLWQMEKKGVLIDVKYLEEFREKLIKEIEELKRTFPPDLNLISPKQVGKYLFETLKLTPKGYTKKGTPSTDEKFLSLMPDEEAKRIVHFRELSHTLSTFVDAYLSQIDKSNRLHCEFKQLGARTGRMSCKKPNLQQVAKEEAVRRIFIGEENILAADYHQMEAVLYAHFSGDEKFIQMFYDNPDVYSVFASQIFHVPIDKVREPCVIIQDKTYRDVAKGIVLGMMYGMGEKKFKEITGEALFPELLEKFPVLYNYGRQVSVFTMENGYVRTLLGRYRHLPPHAAYKGVNAKVQGSASDVVKLVMISLPKSIQERMLIQVHDELLFENITSDEANIIRECMTDFNLKVPLKVNIGIGPNWWEASENATLFA